MSSVLWAKTQQLQEDAFRQLQNIYGERRKIFLPPTVLDNDLFCDQIFVIFDRNLQKEEQSSTYFIENYIKNLNVLNFPVVLLGSVMTLATLVRQSNLITCLAVMMTAQLRGGGGREGGRE